MHVSNHHIKAFINEYRITSLYPPHQAKMAWPYHRRCACCGNGIASTKTNRINHAISSPPVYEHQICMCCYAHIAHELNELNKEDNTNENPL